MTTQTTYTQARDGLAKLLDQVILNREVVIVQRRGKEKVAMTTASELESLTETSSSNRSLCSSRLRKWKDVHTKSFKYRKEVKRFSNYQSK